MRVLEFARVAVYLDSPKEDIDSLSGGGSIRGPAILTFQRLAGSLGGMPSEEYGC